MRELILAALLALSLASTGCEAFEKLTEGRSARTAEPDEDEDDAPKKKKKSAASASASAQPSTSAPPAASASASAAASAHVVTIPAGTLKAGAACAAVPRVTNEELPGTSVELGEFTIDVYPYPNDPATPPKLGVTRDEAERLCKEAGKRLCTELEWERACKGADNAAFEYGSAFDKDACEGLAKPELGKRPKCKSGFGVSDMHGLAFEWTMSAWGRGQGSGLGAVRGYKGSSNMVRERCASGAGRDPGKEHADVGFRCCGGPVNPAAVDLTLVREPVLVDDRRPDRSLAADLLKAMPEDHQKVEGATVSFDRVWRWHPRDNEELLVARWTGRRDKGRPFYEIAVFKVCSGVVSRVTRMRGPVEKLDVVREDGSPEKLAIDVATDKDRGKVTLGYWYGSVSLTQPEWVKTASSLPDKEAKPVLIPRPVLKRK